MAKRWTIEEDEYLAMYFDVAGAFCMSMDLGRPEKQCTARVKKLIDCGAWVHLRAMIDATHKHRTAYLVAIGRPPQDILDERLAAIGAGVQPS